MKFRPLAVAAVLALTATACGSSGSGDAGASGPTKLDVWLMKEASPTTS